MNSGKSLRRTRWFKPPRTYRWSVRSILLLTSLIAYIVCLARYYPDLFDSGVRSAISCFLIVGIVPRIVSRRGTENDQAATAPWQKALLLGLLVVMTVCGILTMIPLLSSEAKRWYLPSDEYVWILNRAINTTWSLAIFLSTLACPWMHNVRSRDRHNAFWTHSINGSVAIACIAVLAVIIAYQSLIATLVVMATEGSSSGCGVRARERLVYRSTAQTACSTSISWLAAASDYGCSTW